MPLRKNASFARFSSSFFAQWSARAVTCFAISFSGINIAHAEDTLSVVDFGGKNRQILIDANKDAFVVDAHSGQLYLYDGANTTAPGAKQVYKDHTIAVPEVIVSKGKIVRADTGRVLGEILTDTSPFGTPFSILGYRLGSSVQGYLDVDINLNSRGDINTPADAKQDSRVQQVNVLTFVKTYKKLHGQIDWKSSANVGLHEYRREVPAGSRLVKYNFSVPADGSYQLLLRGFNSKLNDADMRLVELGSGRIIGSSYSSLSSELITGSLRAGKTYGIVISRNSDIAPLPFVLRLKAVTENSNTQSDLNNYDVTPQWIDGLQPGETRKIVGTIRPTTPMEYVPRFIGVANAYGDQYAGKFQSSADHENSGDPGSMSADTLFAATQTLLSSFFIAPPYNVADHDAFMFFGKAGQYTLTLKSTGGTALAYAYNYWNNSYTEQSGTGTIPLTLNDGPTLLSIGDLKNRNVFPYNYSVGTGMIEYEITITPAH